MDRRRLLSLACAAALPLHARALPSDGRDDIVLGQTADFSASRAAISKAYSDGAALHFDEVNAAGGIAGRKVRVVRLDDGYDVQRAQANVRALTEEHKAFALVHLVGTAITEQVLPYVARQGIPLIHALTGADQVRPPARVTREAFFLRASYGREIAQIVSQMRTLGIARIGLLHEDEPFGHGIRDAVTATMKAQRLSLAAVGVLPPNQPGEAAIAPAVAQLARAAPAALIVGSAGPVVEQFIRAYHAAGARTQFYCLSVSNVERLHRALGPLSEGIVVAQVMPSVTRSNFPVVHDYRRAAAARGAVPGSFALEGYISARMVVQALRGAGTPPTRSRFIAAMEAQTLVGGFPVRFRDPRQGSPFVDLGMIGSDGKAVL
jgi:ABC-type branched-subunit amino acid transport system substrate-binding protein